MHIAAIQMVSTPDVATNLATAARLVQQASDQGAELAVLPEYFCLMGHRDRDKLALAETPGHGLLQDFLRETALRHGLWLAGGTIPLQSADPKRIYNATIVINPQGEQVARYDKIHLFAFDNGRETYDESATLLRGNTPVAFTLPSRDGYAWRVGLSICYDLRFPELYRALAADLLLVPSAFTHTTGQAHWEILLRARAIENLAYVAAAAQGGQHINGRHTWGQSLIAGPWGDILAQQAAGEGVVLTECNGNTLQQCRQQLPALQHRVLCPTGSYAFKTARQ
jgi:nitrilase